MDGYINGRLFCSADILLWNWKKIHAYCLCPLEVHCMAEINPNFANSDAVEPAPWGDFGADGDLDPAPLTMPIDNFYMTDAISRASATMARCTEVHLASQPQKTGTDG